MLIATTVSSLGGGWLEVGRHATRSAIEAREERQGFETDYQNPWSAQSGIFCLGPTACRDVGSAAAI